MICRICCWSSMTNTLKLEMGRALGTFIAASRLLRKAARQEPAQLLIGTLLESRTGRQRAVERAQDDAEFGRCEVLLEFGAGTDVATPAVDPVGHVLLALAHVGRRHLPLDEKVDERASALREVADR